MDRKRRNCDFIDNLGIQWEKNYQMEKILKILYKENFQLRTILFG